MFFQNASFEIEFRCRFSSDEEAYRILPFLRSGLKREYSWVDTYYGLDVFKSGQVLRIGDLYESEENRHFLGWKGPDKGTFANIRQELNEEITNGISGSAIMEQLAGKKKAYALQEIIPELERLGYHRFMSYQGQNRAGRDEEKGFNLKLMHCTVLRWPLLVEIEKITRTEAEALEAERELKRLADRYQLQNYIVKEEPGTLLFEKTFG